MHIIFTDEEREWVYTDRFGLPLKPNAPKDVKRSIERKKEIVNNPDLYTPTNQTERK